MPESPPPETPLDLFAARFTRSYAGWRRRFMEADRKFIQPLLPWLFALMFFWMVLAMIPMSPAALDTGLDASWAHALNMSRAGSFVFGRDVLFTYGPLGYLFFPVPGLVSPYPSFAIVWIIHAIFLLGAFLIWRSLGCRLVVFVSWAVLSGGMLLLNLPAERLEMSFLCLAIGIMTLLATRDGAAFIYLAIAGAVAGLIPLFKISEGIAACMVFYSLLATLYLTTARDLRTVWRETRILALVPPLVLALAFILVERNISGLWSYMIGSLRIAMGYSEAMANIGPMYQAILGVFGLVALGFVIPLLADNRRDLLRGFLPALIAGFFAFKSGLVRQDDMHAALLLIKLAVAGVFLLICTRSVRDRRLLITYVLATLCLGAVMFLQAFPDETRLTERRALLQDTAANFLATWHLASTWAQMNTITQLELTKVRLDAAVSDLVSSGTVDDVPSELDIVEANRWRWKPRPIFQSYSAYLPALDQLNARHLASRESADHIIMQWEDIDGRQPLLDDAASWRSLFDHYDVVLRRPRLLVLKRRDSPRYLQPREIGAVIGTWGTEIPVPDPTPNRFAPDAFTMMQAEIGKGFYGALRGIVFRNSAVYLNATYASGKTVRWRVTRANLADGAFIAYLPQTLSESLFYFGQAASAVPDQVISIRFETPGWLEFSSSIRISWYSVAFRPDSRMESMQPSAREPVPATGASARLLNLETRSFIDDVNGHPLAAGSFQASSGRPIVISGWAVDEPAHRTAGAVYIDVDGQLFPASYGSPRSDVAAALKDPGCERSGFKGMIQTTPGSHKVALRIVNNAGTGYYAGQSFTLNVN